MVELESIASKALWSKLKRVIILVIVRFSGSTVDNGGSDQDAVLNCILE